MVKLDLTKYKGMELPELDIVQATPILINLGEKDGKKLQMIFEIPCVNDYFNFEAKYAKLLVNHFACLSGVNFLTYKEFKDEKLVERLQKELKIVLQNEAFKKDFVFIIQKYFKANFKVKKMMSILNLMQMQYLFLFLHYVVETVKKKAIQTLQELGAQITEIFSTSLSESSEKIEPRF